MPSFEWLNQWGNRNRGGGAAVGGLAGPEANPLHVPTREIIALDEEMARRAGMTRDRGESLPQLPPVDDADDWNIQWDPIPAAVAAASSSNPRMSGRR